MPKIILLLLSITLSGCVNDSIYVSKHEEKQMDEWVVAQKPRNEQFSAKPIVQHDYNELVSSTTTLNSIETNSFSTQLKIALVIGNSRYAYSPLKNPSNDARDIAQALNSLNFRVTLKTNANQEQMETAITEFGKKLTEGGVGLFYYAGHALQVNGNNYLIPLDAKISKQSDIRYKAVNLGQVLDGMGEARNGLNIAILDACRDNPLPRSYRSGSRGLARVNSPEGTLLVFSTSPGSTASDGEGRNGLYTKYLLKHIETPNISIETTLKRVSRDVKKESLNNQTPWMESSFSGDFSFTR